MKFQQLPRLLAVALLCAAGVSCSMFQKKEADPYAQDGGYNPYGGQPGQDFQATVNQALFFGTGGTIDGWL